MSEDNTRRCGAGVIRSELPSVAAEAAWCFGVLLVELCLAPHAPPYSAQDRPLPGTAAATA